MNVSSASAIGDLFNVYEKSKLLSESIIDSITAPLLIIDDDGVIYRANRNAGRILSQSHEYLPGLNLCHLFTSDQQAEFRTGMQKVGKSEEASAKFELEMSDGIGKTTFLWDIQPFGETMQKLRLYQLVGTDVTAFKKRIEEKALYESQLLIEQRRNQRLNLHLVARENLKPNALDHSIEETLKKLRQVLGFDLVVAWREENVKNKKLLSPYWLDSANTLYSSFIENWRRNPSKQKCKGNVHLALEKNEVLWAEDLLSTTGETYYSMMTISPFQISLTILLRNSHKVYAAVEFLRASNLPFDGEMKDTLNEVLGKINEYIHRECLVREIAQKNAQITHRAHLTSIGELASGVAHEINNPLTIIRGKTVKLLRSIGPDTENSQGLKVELQKMDASVRRIAKIVQGLRIFSDGSDAEPMKLTDFLDIMSNVLDLTNQRFAQEEVSLGVKEIPKIKVLCRHGQIVQVLVSLLSNALYAVTDLVEKWVQIDFHVGVDVLEITFTDSGPGILPELSSRIFEPFFTTKPVGKGTGLGLSIAHGIIENHKGELYLDKSSSHTKFIVRLPIIN
jgi:PAS domain S-box-containing protein